MDFWHVFILSIVEGITEFLPISSTGHLILTARLLDIQTSEYLKTFEIVIQLGAILAVVVLYWKKFFISFDIYKNLFLAFLPTALIGFFVYPIIKAFLGDTQLVVWTLFLGGVFILLFEKFNKYIVHSTQYLDWKHYFIIGLIQSISMIPGVSRAMATIYGGRIVGLSKKEATEFSFLLAIPTMLSASVYDVYKSYDVLLNTDYYYIAIGFVGSFIFALISVKFLVNFIKNHDFKIFGVYRIALAILFWMFVGGRTTE